MQVYDIKTTGTYSQIHSVVAESMAEAERVFMGKYWPCTIHSIELHSEYVQIQKHDEQLKIAPSQAEEAQNTIGQQAAIQNGKE